MNNEDLEEECRTLAAFTEEDHERSAILKDSLIDQISREHSYTQEQATMIVDSTVNRLRGEQPERIATLELRDGQHRLPSGGILIVKDGHIQELHAPRVRRMDTDHEARKITVAEANKAARCDFYVTSMWKQTNVSWVVSCFRSGKEPC